MGREIGELVLTLFAAGFLLFYGLGLLGWPYDVTRGIKLFERMNPRVRQAIAAMLIAGSLVIIALQLAYFPWRR